jgi:Domain of unknown function (DUF4386)
MESPRLKARIAGGLYLVVIAGGLFAEIVREQVVAVRDPAATAQNILANEALYRAGFAAGLAILMCAVPILVILYGLLKTVDRSVALLMVFFDLVSIAAAAANLLNHFEPLVLLGGERYLDAGQAALMQPLAYMALRMQSAGYNLSLSFFAWFCLTAGYLIFRSTFFPRFLGVLMAVAGVSYLANSFAFFLAPAIAGQLFPAILVPSFVGELALALWLLTVGVNVPRWEQHARRG